MLKQNVTSRVENDCPDYLTGPAPFQNSCSIYQFFSGGDRGLILDAVVEDLQTSEKSVRIVGEPGSGKTMLSLVLAHRLKSKFNIVRYDHPQASAEQLIQHLLIEFCPLQTQQNLSHLSAVDVRNDVGHSDLDHLKEHESELQSLERALVESGSIKPIVIMVDSSNVEAESWPLLDRLARLRANGRQIVRTLVLDSSADAVALQDSITASPDDLRREHIASGQIRYHLRRLSLSEIHDYLQHHMLLFDFNRRQMFSREMAYFIADRTQGLLKEVNLLARNACTLAGLQNDSEVTMSHLLSAGLPPEPEEKKSRTIQLIKAAGFRVALGVASVVVVLTTFWLSQV